MSGTSISLQGVQMFRNPMLLNCFFLRSLSLSLSVSIRKILIFPGYRRCYKLATQKLKKFPIFLLALSY
jgi:hypothetical protein